MPQLWWALHAAGHLHIDRLIAVARVALSGFALLVVYLDPTEFAQNVFAISITLWVYLVWALITLSAVISGRSRPEWHITLHLTDICLISLLMSWSKGPASPFYVFYGFVLLAVAMRWNWPGVVS